MALLNTSTTRRIFNGQTWQDAPSATPTLTPEQERAQASFASSTRSTVDELLNLQSAQTKEQADADAARLTATGYSREADAYESAALTSEESAHLSQVSGDLQAYQDMRKYQATAGSQAAQVSANGFKNAGSALYLAKSGFQQAQLTRQIDVLNGTEKSIGYLETAAASRAQGSAASAAGGAATALATADDAAAGTTGTNISNLSTAMQQYFHTVDPTSVTPEARLSLGLLGDNPQEDLSATANQLTRESAQPQNQPLNTASGGWGRNLAWGLH
jgi:hypothetical protein